MTTWMDKLQYQTDSMEDPNCCTKPEPMHCTYCEEPITEGLAHVRYDCAFCNEGCASRYWSDNRRFYEVNCTYEGASHSIHVCAIDEEHAKNIVLRNYIPRDGELVQLTNVFELDPEDV